MLCILISSTAFADERKNNADNFKGLNLGVGLSLVKFNSDYFDQGGSQNNNRFDTTNTIPRFDGSYMFELNDKWLLGLGLSLDLMTYNGDKRSISYSYSVPGEIHIRTKNHYSVYLEPTYAVNDSLGVFSKLGYHSFKITDVWNCPSSGCVNDIRRLDGLGLGLGIKKMIDENIYVQLEGEYVKYSSTNDSRTGYTPWGYHNNYSYSGTASAGYHF